MALLSKLLILTDGMFRGGFLCVEITDGFQPEDDVLTFIDIGPAKPFQLKHGGKALYTVKDQLVGQWIPLTRPDDKNPRGYLLAFSNLSRVSGSMLQVLLRSFTYENTADPQYDSSRTMDRPRFARARSFRPPRCKYLSKFKWMKNRSNSQPLRRPRCTSAVSVPVPFLDDVHFTKGNAVIGSPGYLEVESSIPNDILGVLLSNDTGVTLEANEVRVDGISIGMIEVERGCI